MKILGSSISCSKTVASTISHSTLFANDYELASFVVIILKFMLQVSASSFQTGGLYRSELVCERYWYASEIRRERRIVTWGLSSVKISEFVGSPSGREDMMDVRTAWHLEKLSICSIVGCNWIPSPLSACEISIDSCMWSPGKAFNLGRIKPFQQTCSAILKILLWTAKKETRHVTFSMACEAWQRKGWPPVQPAKTFLEVLHSCGVYTIQQAQIRYSLPDNVSVMKEGRTGIWLGSERRRLM